MLRLFNVCRSFRRSGRISFIFYPVILLYPVSFERVISSQLLASVLLAVSSFVRFLVVLFMFLILLGRFADKSYSVEKREALVETSALSGLIVFGDWRSKSIGRGGGRVLRTRATMKGCTERAHKR